MQNTFKVLYIVMIIGLFIIPTASYADWNGHDGHDHGGHGHDGGGHDHDRHGHSFIGVNFSVWPNNYYYYGSPYYPYYPTDAVLVSPPVYEQPVTVVQPPTVAAYQEESAAPAITAVGAASDVLDAYTINIPNHRGGYTAVTLQRSGNGYIGPQGEFYQEFPKVSQLEVLYGK